MTQANGSATEYTLYFVQEELAVFNLLVIKQEAMDKYFCMDHELGCKYNLYFLSRLENARYCVKRKIPGLKIHGLTIL